MFENSVKLNDTNIKDLLGGFTVFLDRLDRPIAIQHHNEYLLSKNIKPVLVGKRVTESLKPGEFIHLDRAFVTNSTTNIHYRTLEDLVSDLVGFKLLDEFLDFHLT